MTEGLEKPLKVEVVDGNIAIIRLDRPSARNAVNGEMTQQLTGLVDQFEADSAIRVVVVGSTSKDFFCAGADLKMVAAGRVAELRSLYGFAGLIDAPRTKPWIAAVNGYALGGGCEIALSCDMIVAGTGAKFGLPEPKRGLMANAGGAHRIARVLPRHIALEIVATGDPIDAARAAHFGMVNHLVAPEEVDERAVELARSIAANAPLSVTTSLMITRQAGDRSDAELRLISRDAARAVFNSEDAKEGPAAFVEKRKPEWKGC